MTPIQIVEKVYAAFAALDLEGVYALLADNVVYQNMAQAPVQGKEALRQMWGKFGRISHLSFEILNTARNGNVVLNERLDHLVIDGREIRIPMSASFTIEQGKIVAWREYYDMATMERQLGHHHPGGTVNARGE